MVTYLDTSALAKRYFNEPRSDEFEAWLEQAEDPVISSLARVEMRSLLARHRRMCQIDRDAERRIMACFLEDMDRGHLTVVPLEDDTVRAAALLIDRLGGHALRTLDAIHLAACESVGGAELATADRIMARAGSDLGLRVVRFD